MQHNRPGRRWRKTIETADRLARWSARHRRTAARAVLRGACHGVGTGAVSLLVLWAQRRL